jgi:hypothetical protein
LFDVVGTEAVVPNDTPFKYSVVVAPLFTRAKNDQAFNGAAVAEEIVTDPFNR